MLLRETLSSRWRRKALSLCLLLLSPAPTQAAVADAPLQFGTSFPGNSTGFFYAQDYLGALCRHARLHCTLKNLPPRRGQALMESGRLDGEMGRQRDFPHELRLASYLLLDVPLLALPAYAFTAPSLPLIDTWQDLAERQSSVSYPSGAYRFRRRLEQLTPTLQLHDTASALACLEIALARPGDSCIFDDGVLDAEARALLAQGSRSKALETITLYTFLNRQHAALLPAFSKAAQHLHKTGVERQLRAKYFGDH